MRRTFQSPETEKQFCRFSKEIPATGNAVSHNSFGHLFRVTTWGESHGPAIGCVVDGCPPRIPLSEADIQPFLDLRRPGRTDFTTKRNEPDAVRILSGVFEGLTTGTPISLMIENTDQRSRDYGDIAVTYRPGHADYAYEAKYGIRDYRGGGRSSARETAMRVAAGGVARKILGDGIRIRGALTQIGPHSIDRSRWDWNEVSRNQFFCPDKEMLPVWEQYLAGIRKAGSSVGAMIEIVAEGVPAGFGAPIYGKLDSDLAAAMMSINAVKSVEIGAGSAVAGWTGPENADELFMQDHKLAFGSNHAGGILGGISTGQDVVVRFAVKPTSSMLVPTRSVTREGEEIEVVTRGRHDPCVGIRAVPVGEAMMACVLADHFLRHRGQTGAGAGFSFGSSVVF
jgi:chorismate synthase